MPNPGPPRVLMAHIVLYYRWDAAGSAPTNETLVTATKAGHAHNHTTGAPQPSRLPLEDNPVEIVRPVGKPLRVSEFVSHFRSARAPFRGTGVAQAHDAHGPGRGDGGDGRM